MFIWTADLWLDNLWLGLWGRGGGLLGREFPFLRLLGASGAAVLPSLSLSPSSSLSDGWTDEEVKDQVKQIQLLSFQTAAVTSVIFFCVSCVTQRIIAFHPKWLLKIT